MKHFISALQFITIIPLGKNQEFNPIKMIPFFPLVGLFLGIILSLFDQIMLLLWPKSVAALLDVLFLAFITGAFHLDGLGDSADGLYGHRKKETALSIMKDSRIGVMGVVAIFACLSIKWGGISGINENRHLFLIIIPAFSRSSILFGIRFLKYLRDEGGTGQAFFIHKLKLFQFWGILIPIMITLVLGWKGIILFGAYSIMVLVVLLYYQIKMSGITGDMLGALIEITEAGLFLAASAGGVS